MPTADLSLISCEITRVVFNLVLADDLFFGKVCVFILYSVLRQNKYALDSGRKIQVRLPLGLEIRR